MASRHRQRGAWSDGTSFSPHPPPLSSARSCRIRPAIRAWSLAVLCPLLLSCSDRQEAASDAKGGGTPPPPNLILIVVDTLRADHVSRYGGTAPTPNIDKLAAAGVLFKRTYAHAPITGPSHASMFTSLLPASHGVHNNAQLLNDSMLTLAEILRSRSWHTAAFVSLGVLSRQFGFQQGFDEYYDQLPGRWWKSANEVNANLIPWLKLNQLRPLFLWLHYSDPPSPYTPPI